MNSNGFASQGHLPNRYESLRAYGLLVEICIKAGFAFLAVILGSLCSIVAMVNCLDLNPRCLLPESALLDLANNNEALLGSHIPVCGICRLFGLGFLPST